VVTQPVRSGAQIYAKGGDLIVLNAVSSGAELIADGNIHVYGTLRGRALAGAAGDAEARIFVNRLEAELLSIAGRYLGARPDRAGTYRPGRAGCIAQRSLGDHAGMNRPPRRFAFAGQFHRWGKRFPIQARRGYWDRVIVVTSGKGGVGKDHDLRGDQRRLALRGKKTVVIDFDVGLRNLDLIMGCERRVVFDFTTSSMARPISTRR